MKNILIIIVAIAVYLHYYPNEQVNEWYDTYIGQAKQSLSEVTDTKVKVAPSKLLTVLQRDFEQYTKSEVAYIEAIASSRKSVRSFHQKYCGEFKGNTRLRHEHVKKACRTIDQYRILN
ncbi:hypothetical protein A9Q98_14275 [Thalassotalea sp. 42_200_T64]|nr:hypothetical protein A9Q98_14275 [Thalassotalea sp. 42_200_T64]